MEINDTTCVITGGTQGIGRAVALALGAKGARVALCGRNAERVESTVAELTGSGVTAWGISCDVSDEAQVIDTMKQSIDDFGRLDGLFADAGRPGTAKAFVELPPEECPAVRAVQLDGVCVTWRAGARHVTGQR